MQTNGYVKLLSFNISINSDKQWVEKCFITDEITLS